MAIHQTQLFTKQTGIGQSQGLPSYPTERDAGAGVRLVPILWTLKGTEVATDSVQLYRSKPGSKVIPGLSKIVCEDPGTALTIDIGDVLDVDRYLDGAALTTAHDAFFPSLPSVTAAAGQYALYEITKDTVDITATIITATTLTAGAKVLILLAVLDA